MKIRLLITLNSAVRQLLICNFHFKFIHYVVIAEIRKKVKVAKSIMVTVTIFCHKIIKRDKKRPNGWTGVVVRKPIQKKNTCSHCNYYTFIECAVKRNSTVIIRRVPPHIYTSTLPVIYPLVFTIFLWWSRLYQFSAYPG